MGLGFGCGLGVRFLQPNDTLWGSIGLGVWMCLRSVFIYSQMKPCSKMAPQTHSRWPSSSCRRYSLLHQDRFFKIVLPNRCFFTHNLFKVVFPNIVFQNRFSETIFPTYFSTIGSSDGRWQVGFRAMAPQVTIVNNAPVKVVVTIGSRSQRQRPNVQRCEKRSKLRKVDHSS